MRSPNSGLWFDLFHPGRSSSKSLTPEIPSEWNEFEPYRLPAVIKHVFVVMLENRSFDHMLGLSGIEGADANSGTPTAIVGLDGSHSNDANGQRFTAYAPAPYIMEFDPGHGFA